METAGFIEKENSSLDPNLQSYTEGRLPSLYELPSLALLIVLLYCK